MSSFSLATCNDSVNDTIGKALRCRVQIVLNSDASAGDLRDNLSYIYGLYVEYVMKNPLYNPGEPFR